MDFILANYYIYPLKKEEAMEKRWVEFENIPKEIVEKLSGELTIDHALASVLVQRGIKNFAEAKSFFRPELDDLHDPFLMKDMEKAVERISFAIINQEKILIYGDYDVDGTTSVTLMFKFLSKFTNQIAFYLPDRYKEGYGISDLSIDFAIKENFKLVIALDCGIKANDKIAKANLNHIDFIICDHHNPGGKLPEALAVLDPKRLDCGYPYKELSGCGVGFKLMQAYLIYHDMPLEISYDFLDLVAVSIASDIVPLTGENRTLAYYGMKKINENPIPGFKALLKSNTFKTDFNITDVVFIIGPRINAAGRMDDARLAVDLLLTENEIDAMEKAKLIQVKNQDRKDFDTAITLEALAEFDENIELQNRKSTVLFNPNWHKGVIGIVASRVIEKHYRPTIILTQSNGVATGSARSVHGFDLYEAIEKCESNLLQYGGHMHAAGLTLEVNKIESFIQQFEKVVSESILEESLTQKIAIDRSITFDQITPKFIRVMNQMAPFGPGNMHLVFCTSALKVKGNASVVGSKHLKLEVLDQNSISFSCIGFNLGYLVDDINKGGFFKMCYTIEKNVWNNIISNQLNIKDLKIESSQS